MKRKILLGLLLLAFLLPLESPINATPSLTNLRNDYFLPTGWIGKRFINYHYDWATGRWVQHTGYTEILNRGNPMVFGQSTLVRWDFIKTGDVQNYWWPGRDINLVFYFREEGGLIYAPGHYPVQGQPDLGNPPSNLGTCNPGEPCSLVHTIDVSQEIGGWESPARPYVYLPVAWDLSTPYHFQRTMRFRHVLHRSEAATGSAGGYEVDWKVTGCYLGHYQFGDTYACEGTVSGARPSERNGEMMVIFQDETGPGFHGIERWYFQRNVGLVAIEGYTPATYYWYFVSLDTQW